MLPVAGDAQKQEFSYVLSKQAYHSVSEGHLWFSIFSRPPSNRFTRVQRCTCCFVLLLTSMLLNILYYDQAAEAKASQGSGGLSMGPLFVTPQQVCVHLPKMVENDGCLLKIDWHWCDCGDSLVLAQYSPRSVLPTNSISVCRSTAVSFAASD